MALNSICINFRLEPEDVRMDAYHWALENLDNSEWDCRIDVYVFHNELLAMLFLLRWGGEVII